MRFFTERYESASIMNECASLVTRRSVRSSLKMCLARTASNATFLFSACVAKNMPVQMMIAGDFSQTRSASDKMAHAESMARTLPTTKKLTWPAKC